MESTPAFFLGICVSSLIWTVAFLVDSMIVQRAANKAIKDKTPMSAAALYKKLVSEGYSVDANGRIMYGLLHTGAWFDVEVALSKTVGESMNDIASKHRRAKAMQEASKYINQQSNTSQP